jgi:hypothetical protein
MSASSLWSGGDKAHASLLLTLTALGANVPEEGKLMIPTVSKKINAEGEVTDSQTIQQLKAVLNGIITNDKFCMSRAGRLQLSWWRLPRSLRLPAAPQTIYPTERHEGEVESQEDRYEGTGVSHPASGHPSSRCTTEVGSSVSESDPMEPWSVPGSFAGSASKGGAQ